MLEAAAAHVDGEPCVTHLGAGSAGHYVKMVHNGIEYGVMQLIAEAYDLMKRSLGLEAVARIWRGGCIIRAGLLEDIRAAYRNQGDLTNLLLNPHLGQAVMQRQNHLRGVVTCGVDCGLPVPALMASLSYFDAYRSARLPANLVQAQRDCFGSHTYERVDSNGVFHTQWVES